MDDRGLLHTSFAHATSTSIDSDIRPSIDAHHTPGSKDPEGQARAMDGRILHISKEDIAEIIFMNGSSNFFNPENRSEDPPSIDNVAAPSIDGHLECRRSTLQQNMKRKPRWENTKAFRPTVPEKDNYNKVEIDEHDHTSETTCSRRRKIKIDRRSRSSIDRRSHQSSDQRSTHIILQSFTYRLDGVNYPLRDSVDSLTTHLDVLLQKLDTIKRQLESRAEPSPSIDRRTRPSIDGDYAALRNNLVTEKSFPNKLDEITFSQDLLKKMSTRS
ncbi:hypothetical protein F2Q70_00003599 [Brassica cretica]|uniref:Uncharacterized protein n=1 Tax=Brassica cretica TaxID=69181 RepID=A0A8S9IRY5_BRACR|nr:hypothetical protein F2Q70_00003599 [Brassica cretica]